jgi:hypothetical protein
MDPPTIAPMLRGGLGDGVGVIDKVELFKIVVVGVDVLDVVITEVVFGPTKRGMPAAVTVSFVEAFVRASETSQE